MTDEISLRRKIRENDEDADAWHQLSLLLEQTGRESESLIAAFRYLQLRPENPAALVTLGQSFRHAGLLKEAHECFRGAYAQDRTNLSIILEIASTLHLAGDNKGAVAGLREAGLDPELISGSYDGAQRAIDILGPGLRQTFIDLLCDLRQFAAAAIVAKTLWLAHEKSKRTAILLTHLLFTTRDPEFGRFYLEVLAAGFPVKDFRPRSQGSTLSSVNPKEAALVFALDHRQYSGLLASQQAGGIWTPLINADGTVSLRAMIPGRVLSPAFSLTCWAEASIERRVPAHIELAGANSLVSAEVTALPGEYILRLLDGDRATGFQHTFNVAASDEFPARTLQASIVGTSSVTLVGRTSGLCPGARYRFEYGLSPGRLESCTDWCLVPPPRTASFFQHLYRTRGDWLTSADKPGWTRSKNSKTKDLGPLSMAEGRPSLLIGEFFAKDRNQLNGIGSHEMPVGFAWCHDQAYEMGLEESRRRRHAGMAGGVADLRDAEFSFVVRGELQQKGSACHFWIAHRSEDERGTFNSQWALTETPLLDEALEDGAWHEVKIELPNDPQAWTYTGNNPQEQGERANRYRRQPLDTTLSLNNQAFVLIFALGNERDPPRGNFWIYSAAARFRDHSILARAFGSTLLEWPRESLHDPLLLTEGSRGFDDRLWISERRPAFPAQFRWRLKVPTRLTHFQLNQHPYFPAKAVEVLVEDETGVVATVFAGDLPEGNVLRDEPDYCQVFLDQTVAVVAITLRVLSSYREEYWGLDGIEVYGLDAPFTPDGLPCSVSCEVNGFQPGERVYYRVVLEENGERLEGDTRSIDLPVSQVPIIETVRPLVRRKNPACYFVRANAMGAETVMWGELTLPDGTIRVSASLYLGRQPTARHAHYFPAHLEETEGIMRLHAKNEFGTASLVVQWPIAAPSTL